MKYVDKTRVTFHHGCGFDAQGIDKKPFATFIITDIVQRELIDKICDLMKEYHDTVGEFCNIKIQSEDWDC